MNEIIFKCEIDSHGQFAYKYCPICGRKAIICNHRALRKIIFNRLFRLFGYQIVSIFSENDDFVGYRFCKFHNR